MNPGTLWTNVKRYPGITGFVLTAVGFYALWSLATEKDKFGVDGACVPLLFVIPMFAVLCEGALVNGIRELLHSEDGTLAPRNKLLRWMDIVSGLAGLCPIVLLGFVPNTYETPFSREDNTIITFAFLIFGGILYYFLSERNYIPPVLILSATALAILGQDLFSPGAYSYTSQKDMMIGILNNIAGTAYQYRVTPKSMGGGQGAYLGYTIPPKMADVPGKMSFRSAASKEIVQFQGRTSDGTSGIRVKLDSDGKLFEWRWQGEWEPEYPGWMWRTRDAY